MKYLALLLTNFLNFFFSRKDEEESHDDGSSSNELDIVVFDSEYQYPLTAFGSIHLYGDGEYKLNKDDDSALALEGSDIVGFDLVSADDEFSFGKDGVSITFINDEGEHEDEELLEYERLDITFSYEKNAYEFVLHNLDKATMRVLNVVNVY